MAAKYRISLNMEYCRSADYSFDKGVKKAAEIGYRYIEPMVHTGWELLSEVHYFHSFSMEEDPLLMKEICDEAGVKVSSLSGHSPLMKPEASVPRLTRAIVLAESVGAKFVNTDEMVKPEWMSDEVAHQVMSYTLSKAAMAAQRHGIYICVEPHGVYTKTSEGLMKIVRLVDSP
ncbi:MAG: TIM barrel protein, partial [Planctomycetota bacterium]|nr:TIM barrel protein [Planctomycetota bacterium]